MNIRQKRRFIQENACTAICGDGWLDLIISSLEKIGKAKFIAIKEEFGYLDIIIEGSDRQQKIANEARSLSLTICENCSNVPVSTELINSSIKTLCNSCKNKELK